MQRSGITFSFALIVLTSLISSCGLQNTLTGNYLFPGRIQNPPLIVQSTQSVASRNTGTDQNNHATINAVFQGSVVKLLPDDNSGLKHEKFMFQISDGVNGQYDGQTVMVAHDISMAPYVPIKVGSQLEIKGDFITNISPKVLHWTHRDENHVHPDGYVKMDGKIYQ